jgi:hypothetical protein
MRGTLRVDLDITVDTEAGAGWSAGEVDIELAIPARCRAGADIGKWRGASRRTAGRQHGMTNAIVTTDTGFRSNRFGDRSGPAARRERDAGPWENHFIE